MTLMAKAHDGRQMSWELTLLPTVLLPLAILLSYLPLLHQFIFNWWNSEICLNPNKMRLSRHLLDWALYNIAFIHVSSYLGVSNCLGNSKALQLALARLAWHVEPEHQYMWKFDILIQLNERLDPPISLCVWSAGTWLLLCNHPHLRTFNPKKRSTNSRSMQRYSHMLWSLSHLFYWWSWSLNYSTASIFYYNNCSKAGRQSDSLLLGLNVAPVGALLHPWTRNYQTQSDVFRFLNHMIHLQCRGGHATNIW